MKLENIKNENDLRQFIRECVDGDRLEWSEPARGSSVGHPDVNIRFDWFNGRRYEIPFELKCWNMSNEETRCEMRPSQRRYHIKAANDGLWARSA